ncbi:hypothetical protein M758_4G162200 [Ceratodon purpureus]|nr:hypothetical protein M758_4G162200 [Ceratodon purpureus]
MPSQFFLLSFHFLTIWVGEWVTGDGVFFSVDGIHLGCVSGFNSLGKCFRHYQSLLCWRIRFLCRCSVLDWDFLLGNLVSLEERVWRDSVCEFGRMIGWWECGDLAVRMGVMLSWVTLRV